MNHLLSTLILEVICNPASNLAELRLTQSNAISKATPKTEDESPGHMYKCIYSRSPV
jgi:hypothetical protein